MTSISRRTTQKELPLPHFDTYPTQPPPPAREPAGGVSPGLNPRTSMQSSLAAMLLVCAVGGVAELPDPGISPVGAAHVVFDWGEAIGVVVLAQQRACCGAARRRLL